MITRRFFLGLSPATFFIHIPQKRVMNFPVWPEPWQEKATHEYVLCRNGSTSYHVETFYPKPGGRVTIPIGDGWSPDEEILYDSTDCEWVNKETGEVFKHRMGLWSRLPVHPDCGYDCGIGT